VVWLIIIIVGFAVVGSVTDNKDEISKKVDKASSDIKKTVSDGQADIKKTVEDTKDKVTKTHFPENHPLKQSAESASKSNPEKYTHSSGQTEPANPRSSR
jgi:Sec-independent protein translocase protein TatA